MIYARIKDAARYRGIHPNLDTAIDRMLEGFDAIQLGRNEVDGDQVWLNCFVYETVPKSAGALEYHKHHADIHIILEGEEMMFCSPLDHLTEFERDEAGDYYGVRGETQIACPLRPGDFLVTFPEDAHQVKVQVNGPMTVKNAVFKFAL